jgi:hypothetical protein
VVLLSGCLGINTTRKLEKRTKKVFTNRLEGKTTGLASHLDLHGYFGATQTGRSDSDTMYFNLLLYEDGTSNYDFQKSPDFNTYDDYFTSIIEKGKTDLFYKGLGWGVYRLSGDTIKIQEVSHAANLTARFTAERWFVIEDNHTLRLIAQARLGDTLKLPPAERTAYKFYPLSVIPPAIPWLKKEKFFWRNESDWEQYMQMIKTHK